MDNEERFEKIENKILSLEKRMLIAEINIEEITKKLDKIESNTSKIIWLIVAAVILSILNQIIKGGVII